MCVIYFRKLEIYPFAGETITNKKARLLNGQFVAISNYCFSTKSIPHFAHLSPFAPVTSGCIGQTKLASAFNSFSLPALLQEEIVGIRKSPNVATKIKFFIDNFSPKIKHFLVCVSFLTN